LYLSIGMCDLFVEITWPNCSGILWNKQKYCTQSMQDAIPHHGFSLCDQNTWFDRKFCLSSCKSERETLAWVLFGSFAMAVWCIKEQ